MATCTAGDCNHEAKAQGLCQKHYMRLRRTGSLEDRPKGRRRRDLPAPGWTTDANGVPWHTDGRQRNRGEWRTCATCGGRFPFVLAKAKHQPGLYCSRKCSNRADKPGRSEAKGGKGRYINAEGYVRITDPERGRDNQGRVRYVLEHRLVMEEAVGRALRPEETVHHRNGDKLDNRLENLELWPGRHPRGQRVEDVVEYAVEMLALYAPERLRA